MLSRPASSSEQRLRPLSYSKAHVILIAFSIDTPDSLDNVNTKVRGPLFPPTASGTRLAFESNALITDASLCLLPLCPSGSRRSGRSAATTSPSCSSAASRTCATRRRSTSAQTPHALSRRPRCVALRPLAFALPGLGSTECALTPRAPSSSCRGTSRARARPSSSASGPTTSARRSKTSASTTCLRPRRACRCSCQTTRPRRPARLAAAAVAAATMAAVGSGGARARRRRHGGPRTRRRAAAAGAA